MCAWATDVDPQAPQALLIGADYGVGKSAFLAEMIGTGAAGLTIAAKHFCTTEQEATQTPAVFVRSLAAQLAQTLPAFRQALEADNSSERRRWLDAAAQDPRKALQAFDQAVLAPFCWRSIRHHHRTFWWWTPSMRPRTLAPTPARPRPPPSCSCCYANRLPPWLKLLATSRRRPELLHTLCQAFSLKELYGEETRNLDDLRTYTEGRCHTFPLAQRIHQARLSPAEVAAFLCGERQSSGKFLDVVKVLRDLESGQLPIHHRSDLEALPPGLDGFYADAFQ